VQKAKIHLLCQEEPPKYYLNLTILKWSHQEMPQHKYWDDYMMVCQLLWLDEEVSGYEQQPLKQPQILLQK
jgi:hypothetical protein